MAIQVINIIVRAMSRGLCEVYYIKRYHLQIMIESEEKNSSSERAEL
jgi:hypothetical protein